MATKSNTKKKTAAKKPASKSQTKSKSAASRSTSSKAKTSKKITASRSTAAKTKQTVSKPANIDYTEIFLWFTILISILMFIGNLGYGGSLGKSVSSLILSYFGMVGYLAPFILSGVVFYCVANLHNVRAMSKLVCGLLFLVLLCTLIELFAADGGAIGGILVTLLQPTIGKIGTFFVVLVLIIIDYMLIFEKSAFAGMKKAGSKGREAYANARVRINERAESLALEEEYEEEEAEERAPKRMERKTEGVTLNTSLKEQTTPPLSQDDLFGDERPLGESLLSSLVLNPAGSSKSKNKKSRKEKPVDAGIPDPSISELKASEMPVSEIPPSEIPMSEIPSAMAEISDMVETEEKPERKKRTTKMNKEAAAEEVRAVEEEALKKEAERKELQGEQTSLKHLPPYDLLKAGSGSSKFHSAGVETKKKLLKETLETFGVAIKPADPSDPLDPDHPLDDVIYTTGPSVTRFEFRPGPGVKVAKIMGLADDIKLSLSAPDIRIEAPIPGKNAVGIEVPNDKKTSILLRDLLETKEFESSKSKVTYAVGKDIGGNTIISDIAKMPHLLIAGATGSGKSVFINTLIMSILYKASPDEVKFIMIDPKVVELSVYNDLPHLLIPVVTDPKKAAGALNWAVAEMTKRYQAFATEGVRDIKSFNAKADATMYDPDRPALTKMTQIVVIVDELADLMMVAPKDVEEAICRLAQLARAAGIHLVLATQRPSVNVITGLIKANMPSRIALSVTSGVDSRTIIDMNGAEKLLGNGDMLFYPTGYTKPVRIQGAYVSDDEIHRVVNYIKENNEAVESSADIAEAIENHSIGNTTVQIGNSDNNERDSYFGEAGRLIIDKDKASIGMLQRQFKIGFNRAARIMDQLHESGVVGPEEGTKPRKILMNAVEFEQYLQNY